MAFRPNTCATQIHLGIRRTAVSRYIKAKHIIAHPPAKSTYVGVQIILTIGKAGLHTQPSTAHATPAARMRKPRRQDGARFTIPIPTQHPSRTDTTAAGVLSIPSGSVGHRLDTCAF